LEVEVEVGFVLWVESRNMGSIIRGDAILSFAYDRDFGFKN
jgi:hypothetical protein